MTDLPSDLLDTLLHEHAHAHLPRLERLWAYYRNPLSGGASGGASGGRHARPVPAQAIGLPPRLRAASDGAGAAAAGGVSGGLSGGVVSGGGDLRPRRELVIENDIAWRVHTLVDFMFGRAVGLHGATADPDRAAAIGGFLRGVFERHGGVTFFTELGLLGSVYGFVDVLVRVDEARGEVLLEAVPATRAVPLLDPDDYRVARAYVVHCRRQTHDLEPHPLLSRVRQAVLGRPVARRAVVEHTHVWTEAGYTLYAAARGGRRRAVHSSANRLGRVPVVHIQNLPQPFAYAGLSEVEPLVPLQDELNTRLSDRANRVAFQSFKMYLGKGIEGFLDRPVGPGQMWATDDKDASIEEFGGDAACPSEDRHIDELREAMDKCSGVTPIAAGVLRDRVGNLTSENALRVTMLGLLAKTQRKRVTYGAGIARLCELILHAADVHGLFPNTPDERAIRIDWPDPVPAGESQQLEHARLKLALGVPRERVLAELGYSDCVH